MTAANMNQRELARRCDVKPPSVNGWLSGKSKFLRGENLLKAAAALGVSDQWLATGKGARDRKAAPLAHSQPMRLDLEIVRLVARELQSVYQDEFGRDFIISAEPELFAEVYDRTAERGEVDSRSSMIWLGSRIGKTQQGASRDERSESIHGASHDQGKAGPSR